MTEINNENKYVIIVVGSAIFISLFLAIIIGKPLYDSIKKAGTELEERSTVLDKLESNLVVLKELESKKEDLEKKNEKVIAAFPEDKDIARLFYQFESLANKAGVSIVSVGESSDNTTASTEVDNQPSSATIVAITYQVIASSKSYSALKNALANIEDSLRILSIETIEVAGESDNLGIKLNVKTYKRG